MKSLSRKVIIVLGAVLLLAAGFAVKAQAAKLPSKDEVSERWFYIYAQEGTGSDFIEFPKGTTFSDFKYSAAGVKAKKFSEKHPDGKKHYFLQLKATKPGVSKVSFTAKLGKKNRKYTVEVHAMEYKNPVKLLKVGRKDYTANYDEYDSTCSLEKGISGKLTVKANKGFRLKEISIYDTKTDKSRKIKNGSNIKLKKGQILEIFYYYKKYDCNGGLGFLFVEG